MAGLQSRSAIWIEVLAAISHSERWSRADYPDDDASSQQQAGKEGKSTSYLRRRLDQ